MDVVAATDEIPSKALSCSTFIEMSNPLEDFENSMYHVGCIKTGLEESRMSLSRNKKVSML